MIESERRLLMAGHGGKRAGSGRKPTGKVKQYATTSITGSAEEIQLLRDQAKAAGKSMSRYVIDWVVEQEQHKDTVLFLTDITTDS